MGDDSIDMVISHINMGYLVTLVMTLPIGSGSGGQHRAQLLRGGGRGLHSFTLELKLSNSRTYSRFKLGYTVEGRAQVELKWERV